MVNPLKRKRTRKDEGVDQRRKQTPKTDTHPLEPSVATPADVDGLPKAMTSSTSSRRLSPEDHDIGQEPSTEKPAVDHVQADDATEGPSDNLKQPASDQDWIRSHTSRLLGLVDDEEEAGKMAEDSAEQQGNASDAIEACKPHVESQQPTPPKESKRSRSPAELDEESDAEAIGGPQLEREDEGVLDELRQSGRVFVRNLPYTTTEAELAKLFEPFGPLREVCRVSTTRCLTQMHMHDDSR